MMTDGHHYTMLAGNNIITACVSTVYCIYIYIYVYRHGELNVVSCLIEECMADIGVL